MNQRTAKSINREAGKIAQHFAYPFPKKLARSARRAYEATPIPERKNFRVQDVLLVNK